LASQVANKYNAHMRPKFPYLSLFILLFFLILYVFLSLDCATVNVYNPETKINIYLATHPEVDEITKAVLKILNQSPILPKGIR